MNTAIDANVLIVGAGPVGLFLANECARRGLSFRIIEERSSQSEHSKALAIFPRTLEIFDMAGVVDPFLKKANRVTSVAVVTHGRTLAHMHFTPEESPYSFVAMVPQDVTETLSIPCGSHRREGSPAHHKLAWTHGDWPTWSGHDDADSRSLEREGQVSARVETQMAQLAQWLS